MGFPCATIKMPKPLTITILSNLLYHIIYMVKVTLECLSLSNPQEQDHLEEHAINNSFVMDQPYPSLVPVPIHPSAASIKKSLPVVEYCTFLERLNMQQEDEDTVCAICLIRFSRGQEIRELSNCSHVFHRQCLDSWVDEGQVTCPMCRSMLYPDKEEPTMNGGDWWMMETNAYLFGEDYVI